MERFIWKTGVRFESLPIELATGATDGQITWAFINALVDYEEERAKVHLACIEEWETDRCPVCNKPVGKAQIDQEIIKKYEKDIYRPGEDLSNLTQTVDEKIRREELARYLEGHGSSVRDEVVEDQEEFEEVEE